MMGHGGCRDAGGAGGGTETVAIVGGGCAGVLAAVHLLAAARPLRLVLFEPADRLGAGAAYGTDDPAHLLNAPAGAMSARDDRPDDFVEWLASHGHDLGAADFVPRRLYGRYLRDVLRRSLHEAAPGTRFFWIRSAVTDVRVEITGRGRQAAVHFGTHEVCHAEHVILAVGAPAPGAVPEGAVAPEVAGAAIVVRDPWRPGALDAVPPDADVLLVGSGLTMVDVAVALAARGSGRRLWSRSRRGLLPAVHRAGGSDPWPALRLTATTARGLVRQLRDAVADAERAGADWRDVVSAARAQLPAAWSELPVVERRRFLRHAGRQWEVARHRMAPAVADRIASLERDGVLDRRPGRLRALAPHPTDPGRLVATVVTGGPVDPRDVGSRDHVRPDRVGPDEVSPDRVGLDQVGPDQLGPDQVGPDPVSPDRVGLDRVGLDQVGPDPVSPDPVSPDYLRPDHGGRHHVGPDVEELVVGAVVDCSGPSTRPDRLPPLLARMVVGGVATMDGTGVGLAVDDDGLLIRPSAPPIGSVPVCDPTGFPAIVDGAEGPAVPVGHAFGETPVICGLGWVRRGGEFEATAVPELRRQAARLGALVAAGPPDAGGPPQVRMAARRERTSP